jgi:hypothetical protein
MSGLARTSRNYKQQTRYLGKESSHVNKESNWLTVIKSCRKPQMGALFQDGLAD